MPSGVFFWYITDKNRLDRDDGDLYRVRYCDVSLATLVSYGG